MKSHMKMIGAKPWYIRFDKLNGFIRIYDGTRYLVLVGPEKFDAIYNKKKSQKSGITYVFFINYVIIKIDP